MYANSQRSARKCPECGSTKIFYDHNIGEIVCRDCGLVRAQCIQARARFIHHSSPLGSDLGEYGRLIDIICEDAPNLPRLPHYLREEAKKIIKLVRTHYPTQGRRRTCIVVVALGIARGEQRANDLQDLLYRVKHFTGQEIPRGQVHNTFKELRTFLKNLHIYKSNRRKNVYKLKPEEKPVLRFLKSKISQQQKSIPRV